MWEPSGEKVDLSEGDNEEGDAGAGGEDDEKLKGELYKVDSSKLQPAQPQEFEKDDDLNFHIDFLTAATNMRSWNYDIKASARHTVKVTAGRIIPALATTTALVCGLVDIEFCKLVLGLQSQGSEKFLNSNVSRRGCCLYRFSSVSNTVVSRTIFRSTWLRDPEISPLSSLTRLCPYPRGWKRLSLRPLRVGTRSNCPAKRRSCRWSSWWDTFRGPSG